MSNNFLNFLVIFLQMISNKIKELRQEAGITQKKLAGILNISQKTLGHYETGYVEPNIDTIKKLCVVFGITTDELLEMDTPTQRKNIKINNSLNNNSGKIDIKF